MIEGGDGNCTAQDRTKILDNIKDQCTPNSAQTSLIDMQNIRRYDLEPREVPQQTDHDNCDIPNIIIWYPSIKKQSFRILLALLQRRQ